MATEQNNTFINTFTGGMNTDSAYDTIKNNQYIYAVNLRPYDTSTMDSLYDIAAYGKYGVMTPIHYIRENITPVAIDGKTAMGNKFDSDTIQRAIKVVTSGDANILIKLYKNYIYLYKVEASNELPRYRWTFLCKIKIRKKVGDAVDLRNVSAVLQYETDKVVNLYIADGEHKIMIINVKDTDYIKSLYKIDETTNTTDGEIDVDLISQNRYFPKHAITYKAIVGGQLKTSLVQYTYRFYKKYGVTSKLAPLSRKYQVINPSRDSEVGCAEDTVTSIGLLLGITVDEKIDQFDRLQVYRIQYIKPNLNALIDLIYDGEFTGTNISVIDNGRKTLQTISVEEFALIHGQDIIPKLLEQNQGYLFAGNIKDTTTFQLSRADLKKFWAVLFTPVSGNKYNIPYLDVNTYNKPESKSPDLVDNGDKAVLAFISDEMFNNADYSNPYTDINHSFDADYSNAMFDYNNYVGGSGVYISWRLLLLLIDDDEAIDTSNSYYLQYDLSDDRFVPVFDIKPKIPQDQEENVPLPNAYDIISDCGFPRPDKVTHNDAITSSCIKSLKRGEVYRYGIVLYKNDGTRSDVIWIGDIRIPHPGIIKLNELGTIQIGIEFTLSDAFKEFARTNNICGYEIVRCQRTDECSRSLQQVVISSTVRQQLVDGTYSPYYPTGFIISNPLYIGYTPYPNGSSTQWPKQMTSGASDNRLYLVYCPEIQTYVDDTLNKLKANQISLTPALYLYSPTETDIVRFTNDDAYDDYTSKCVAASYYIQKTHIFSLSFVPAIDFSSEGFDKYNYTFGKYTNVNYKALSYSKSDKSNKVNKLWYLNSASDVYSRRFFMLDSNNKIVYDNGEPVLRPSNINSEYKVDVDNVLFTKDTKFNLNQNNYSMLIREISNVRMLNWEDGFSNHVMDGSKISNAVKKYKSYVKNISTSSYLNWVCSSKYDIPVGTSNEFGWTEGIWKDVVEFTNVKNSGNHEHRTFPSIGPIGPAARCLIILLSDDREQLDKLIDSLYGNIIKSHSLKYIFGEVITTNPITNYYSPSDLGGVLIPSFDPQVNSKDPEEVSKLNSYPGTLLCEITHPAIHYSGKDMSSKQYDTYYGFGDYKKINTDKNASNKAYVFTGDTYTLIYEIEGMYKAYDFNDDKSSLQSMLTIHYIPMESTINQYFDYGMNYRNTNNVNLQSEAGEIKGVSSQDRPIHQYNLIYSDNGTSNDLYSPQSTTHLENTYSQRICYSQLKTNGELLNSWNIFKPVDYIDVNPTYGELTDMLTAQDTLYFWQTKAFGKLSVNERSLVKDENSNLIQLGQGTVLQRFDYLSTKFGMRAQDMCKVNVDNDIYWFDYGNKCIAAYKATSGAYGGTRMSVLDFTESCNVKTLMQKVGESNDVPAIAYDAANDELIFYPIISNYAGYNLNCSLAFNCRLNIAQSLYNLISRNVASVYNLYTKCNDVLSICMNKYSMTYYKSVHQNEGTYEQSLAQLKFVINPTASITKVFDNLQIIYPQLYEAYSGIYYDTNTLDDLGTIYFKTDLDRTTGHQLRKGYYTVREGNICFPIPRCTDGIRRLRGKWMIETIEWAGNRNKAISHIITKFRQSYN
ncbi:hypothetical protein [uncultured phage cr131_1]|uniref:Stabilization protein n=1 Tax=uncultured phage cr131_1 TaxID=2772093 RepID=A0A7M1RTZ1_9CAUD|nr:virion structural protein [uncultured phage cr131_1]QOR57746.1 hypothetical protein [uncultured phage cr131_1]